VQLAHHTNRVPLEAISELYARHRWWSRIVNPKNGDASGRRRRSGKGERSNSGSESSSLGAGRNRSDAAGPPTATKPTTGSPHPHPIPPAAAAASDAPPLVSSAASPFGRQDVQLAEVHSTSMGAAARAPGSSAADAAVAIATASAAAALDLERCGTAAVGETPHAAHSLGTLGSHGGSSRLLQPARTLLGLAGSSRRRSSQAPVVEGGGGADALEQLAAELRHEGS
jgi:hypothetical protein